jgi:hypothetical protein
MSHHELDAQWPAWVETSALCRSLTISRSSLGRWRRRELLRHGHHWVKKNPAAPRSDLLWHRQRCSALLASTRGRCSAMAESSPVQASEPTGDYVLLHRDTGTALYATRATEAKIHRANLNLRRSGNRNRYVAARHLPHQRLEPQG